MITEIYRAAIVDDKAILAARDAMLKCAQKTNSECRKMANKTGHDYKKDLKIDTRTRHQQIISQLLDTPAKWKDLKVSEIAPILGCSDHTAYCCLKELGLKFKNGCRGPRMSINQRNRTKRV